MLKLPTTRPVAARGFTLIELMVAMVIGLIVVGAVLALVVSIMKSNRESLQSTRLNQEMRATMAVITADLRRAHGVQDPLRTATQDLTVTPNPYRTIAIPTVTPANSCITYGYFGSADGDCRAIGLDNGSVKIVGAAPASNACPSSTTSCNLTATGARQLGSDQVVIDQLQFTAVVPNREYQVVLTGHLADSNAQLASISRTITQTVFVRSVGQ